MKKLSDVLDSKVVKNIKFNTLKTRVNNLEKNFHRNQYNTDKQNLEKKIGEIDTKIPDTSGLVTTTVLNTKIGEVKNKIPNHDKSITNAELNKLTAETFAARLKYADLVNKTDFDNKLTSFSKQITSNKKKTFRSSKETK